MNKYVVCGTPDGDLFDVVDGKTRAVDMVSDSISLGFDQEIYVYRITGMPYDVLQELQDSDEYDVSDWYDLIEAHPDYAVHIGSFDESDRKADVKRLFANE